MTVGTRALLQFGSRQGNLAVALLPSTFVCLQSYHHHWLQAEWFLYPLSYLSQRSWGQVRAATGLCPWTLYFRSIEVATASSSQHRLWCASSHAVAQVRCKQATPGCTLELFSARMCQPAHLSLALLVQLMWLLLSDLARPMEHPHLVDMQAVCIVSDSVRRLQTCCGYEMPASVRYLQHTQLAVAGKVPSAH